MLYWKKNFKNLSNLNKNRDSLLVIDYCAVVRNEKDIIETDLEHTKRFFFTIKIRSQRQWHLNRKGDISRNTNIPIDRALVLNMDSLVTVLPLTEDVGDEVK